MSPGPDSPSPLSEADLDQLLPWAFIVDADMRITWIGRSLARHAPEVELGDSVGRHVELVRPSGELQTFDDLSGIAGRLVVVQIGRMKNHMRGAVSIGRSGGVAIFAGSPLVHDVDELGKSGIVLSDFAASDTTPDLLFAMQARDVSIEEAKLAYRKAAMASSRLKSILDSSLNAIMTIDTDGKVIEFSHFATEMFGCSRADAIGEKISTLIITPGLRSLYEAGLDRQRGQDEASSFNSLIEVTAKRADGTTFPVELTIIPFNHEDTQYFTATIRDLTEQKRKDAVIEAASVQERLLKRELDHRVKNMLSQIVVLSRQTETKATVDRDLVQSLTRRIKSFSEIHEVLCTELSPGIEMKALATLCVAPYVHEEEDLLSLDGPSVRLRPKAAITLAMVLNELATNAIKHGALMHEDGSVEISWSQVQDDQGHGRFQLTWRERHGGPLPDQVTGGLGSEILRSAIEYEFGGSTSLVVESTGVCYSAQMDAGQVLFLG